MTGLDCPMQTKAFNLFWHKAELRLVEQPEPEAPVFAISRPTLFGGREEFILQYPARLEPPTERDIARHRFTVRHGKKRRSFQAPDASTFDAWLSALEQVLEPKRESEHFSTPSTTTSNATTATSSQGRVSNATNSQGRVSTAGSMGTRASSRGWANSTLSSNPSSQNSHASQPRAPALRLTLERPCFTRDPNNLKLIRLHRPASTIVGTVNAGADSEDVLDVVDADPEVEEEPEDTVTKLTEQTDNEGVQNEDDSICIVGSTINIDEVADVDPTIEDGNDLHDKDDILAVEALPLAMIVSNSIDHPFENTDEDSFAGVEPSLGESFPLGNESKNDEEIEPEVKTVFESLVDAVVTQQAFVDGDDIAITDRMEVIEPEVVEELDAPMVEADITGVDIDTERKGEVTSAVEARVGTCSSNKEPATAIATGSLPLSTKHKWVPLDPSNSRLIWVRRSIASDVKSAPRGNSKRKTFRPARKWIPVDPSSTRLLWIRRVEHTAARIESRYKATSSTRRWAPLDPENSRFIWVRRSVTPVGGIAIPKVDSSSSRLFRHGKQRRH